MNSGRQINYALRPAKSIERKMMCEFLHKSSELYDIGKYTYIGFGSFYFSDFALFHKNLGINKMCSIEQDGVHRERYEFNKPFSCIDMEYGQASNVLSSIIRWESEEKYFVWLDYDGWFSKDTISDLKTCVNKLSHGSYIAISFSLGFMQSENVSLFTYLKNIAGEYLSPTIKEKDIYPKIISKLIWNILFEVAKEAIRVKNTGIGSGDENVFSIEPVMFFQYKDNAPMMTVCYLIAKERERKFLKDGGFDKIKFFRRSDESYTITVPPLTWMEVRKINSLLPDENEERIIKNVPFIDETDLKNYIKVYKYYPNYLEGQDTL